MMPYKKTASAVKAPDPTLGFGSAETGPFHDENVGLVLFRHRPSHINDRQDREYEGLQKSHEDM